MLDGKQEFYEPWMVAQGVVIQGTSPNPLRTTFRSNKFQPRESSNYTYDWRFNGKEDDLEWWIYYDDGTNTPTLTQTVVCADDGVSDCGPAPTKIKFALQGLYIGSTVTALVSFLLF